ncbi:hypothetical protein HK104_008502 [Borealophlyctis nickersoniae]|nr:hypothetical protein HK104_008502 [Borealophlyctis nickersoniae]
MADKVPSQEQLARIEENRRIAKERLQREALQKQQTESTSAAPPQNTQQNNGNSKKQPSAFQRKKRAIDLNYCEYNFSTMKDTKGGFIVEEQVEPEAKKPKNDEKRVFDPPIDLDPDTDLKCEACKSPDLDMNYVKYFAVFVCRACKDAVPDKYSLLTKTECRQDYMLTDSELRDSTRLPVWERPNPHKSTYSNMLLYLRKHVEAFAWEKWGSPEALDAEFEKREAEKKERKQKKFKTKLAGEISSKDFQVFFGDFGVNVHRYVWIVRQN